MKLYHQTTSTIANTLQRIDRNFAEANDKSVNDMINFLLGDNSSQQSLTITLDFGMAQSDNKKMTLEENDGP